MIAPNASLAGFTPPGKNLDKMDTDCWVSLSINPNIFVYDYEAMKNSMYRKGGFVEELMANRFHPKNMDKWDGWGIDFD